MKAFAPSVSGLALFVGLALPSMASAEDGELRLFNEPHSYVDVADAFDDDDPFDLHIQVAFERSTRLATIQRERPGTGPNLFADVADFEQQVNRLFVGVEVGLYRDLSFFARLPILLSDDRDLTVAGGVSGTTARARLEATDVSPSDGRTTQRPLFELPFASPTRSGFEHLALGLAWSILNQRRDPVYPTWMVRAEVRVPIGGVLTPQPCSRFAEVQEAQGEQVCPFGDDAGSSPGLWGVRLETRASRRFDVIEPFMGLAYDLRVPGPASSRFTPAGDLAGYGNRLPPMEGEFTAGIAIIPWEQRERSQRFSFEVRGSAAYVSQGRAYGPLFDALGTSNTFAVQTPVPECSDPAVCPRGTPFTGLTDVEAHARLGARVSLEFLAAKYIRFALGGAVAYDTAHILTVADACRGIQVDAGDPRAVGCRTGIVNPHHRAVIDQSGNRFRLGGMLNLDVFAESQFQF